MAIRMKITTTFQSISVCVPLQRKISGLGFIYQQGRYVFVDVSYRVFIPVIVHIVVFFWTVDNNI
jgi:hypothetical protein